MCNVHELTWNGPFTCAPFSLYQGFEVVRLRLDNLVKLRAWKWSIM